jgi:DNA-binding response OmpR family regulator
VFEIRPRGHGLDHEPSPPKILAAGSDGYQAKPINVKEFLQVVREMLDRRAGPGGGA